MNRSKAVVASTLILLALGAVPGGLASAGSAQAEIGVVAAPPAVPVGPEVAAGGRAPLTGDVHPAPAVVLRGAAGRTLRFWTQNGRTVDGVRPEAREVPHLVLRRNGALTEPAERTVILEVTGVQVPPSGVTVTLAVETQHGDPDWAGESPPRISVWRQSRWIANTIGITQMAATVRFEHTFEARVAAGSGRLATPTDYFRFDLQVTEGRDPLARPLHTSGRDHAFLMENQWSIPLPEVQEASPGAAPDELVVYYCDMFPLRRDHRDPATWLPREQVLDYVQGELIPAMVEAFRLQTDEWGFPWYPEWTGYRPGADAERLSVALASDQTWFHGQAPGHGSAEISLNVSRSQMAYDSLTDGLMSTFHHELFHNLQRNIQQYLGGSGRVGGAEGAWNFFSEGMAVLASSVGQPEVQLGQTWGRRAYLYHARSFLGREGISEGDLNRSYRRMNPYHAAAYWRFLYEQCGGLAGGSGDPAAGMRIIRQVLVALYAGEVVEVDAETDLVKHLPAIMDEALQGSSCPFQTYRENLLAFTGAIYALRLDGGRCARAGSPSDCGFYDPGNLYYNPPASTITYRGEAVTYSAADQPYPAGIPSSFGADLVEVVLEPAAAGKPLTIAVRSAAGADARFHVEVWEVDERRPATPLAPSVALESMGNDGALVYVVPEIDTAAHNRLGLVITRLDTAEGIDSEGAYTLVLDPDA